jgi:hypothetical protein
MLIKRIINNIKTEDDANSISNCFNLYDATLGNYLISDIQYFNDVVINYKHIDKEEETTVRNLYLKSKKIKNILERFVKNFKIKIYKNYEFYKDLRFIPLKNYDENEIVKLIQNKTIYSFRTLDLIHLLKLSLYNNENMFPMPLKLKNPYTNVYFKKFNLYNILLAFNNTKYFLPEIILCYYKSNFDIIKFKLNTYPLLKEKAIDNFLKAGYTRDLYDYIMSLCHDFRKETNYVLVKTTISIFKKARMVEIFKKILQFYLKKKYLSNPLKKDYFENKCLLELKRVINKYGHLLDFLHLTKLESIQYETAELINEINTLDASSIITFPETTDNAVNSIIDNNVSSLNQSTTLPTLPTPTTPLQNTMIYPGNNFIYRRRSTLYLPPINRDPFSPSIELPRSPTLNNSNITNSGNIRNRLNFGFR